jgi:two-component system sensor histidine kinase VicK
MESQKQPDQKKTVKISQLKGENQDLKEEKKSAEVKIVKLEEEIDLKERYAESQTRFETIFYQSKLGNKIIAPDLKIMQINEVFRAMLGYSEKEIIGTKIIAFAHPDFINHWHELQENLWTRQIPSFQIETCLIKKDGSHVWCQVTSIIFRDNGITLGYTIVEDISERKAMEAELKKLHEDQETMMHMVAHDLKNPLNNIQSVRGLLQKDVEKLVAGSEMKEQSLTLLQMISDTCDKAQAIIRDLLFVGDFNSKTTFRKTDLTNFIESQRSVLGLEAEKKGIILRFHYPSTPVYAHLNKDKFLRLLENLLSNAVKFTPGGGCVTLSLKNKGTKALLQVSDTGIGIPAKWQSSIFDKFTRANRKGTGGETTTGLGLYIVKRIVELHQGTIRVESQENKGTSFFIELR